MKKLFYLIVLIVILGLIVSGCIPVVPPAEQNESGVFPNKGIGDPGEIWNQTTNTQYFTIQAAITAASDSDVIIVGSGEYVEQLTINETLTLQGSGLPTLNVSGFVGSQGVDVSAPNVVIEGFRFIGVPPASNTDFSSNTNPTIRAFTGASGLTVQSNVFDPPSGVINAGKEALLITDGVHNVSFLNNEVNDYIYGLTGRGWTEGTDNILVQGNTFTQTEWLEGPYEGVTEFLTEAVQLWSGDGLKVIDNTFTGPGKFADQFETDNLVNVYAVADFNAYFYAAYGVGTGTETIEITDNEISNYHLGIGAFSGGTIQNNTISDLTVGIQIGQKDSMFATAGITDTLNIIGNDILNNLERGIWVQLTGGEQVEVHCNNIVGNGEFGVEKTNIIDEPSVIVNATHNWWGHATGPHNTSTNPFGQGDEVSNNVNYDNWAYIPDFCDCEAKTIGYWKNHPDYVDGILLELDYSIEVGTGKFVGVVVYAEDIFTKPHSKTYSMLAAQLLAAKLNVAQLSQFISGYDSSCVDTAIADADIILRSGEGGHDYDDPLLKPDKADVNIIKDVLDDFNNNGCDGNDCPCEC